MKREDKYPDTSTFHYFNANPHKRITGDCIIRAISTATGIPYNDVVMEMAKLQCETGYDADGLIDRYLKSKGWIKNKQPKREDGTKYTGKDFCKVLQKHFPLDVDGAMTFDGIEITHRIVANIGGHHIVAIMDGKVWDIWNSTDGCIGNYWTTWHDNSGEKG